MPKLVDYAVRFEFLREAAFAVVRDAGTGALSRRSVAAELGTSVNTVRRLLDADASLARLAADEVTRRRHHGRLGRLRDAAPPEAALHLLRKLLPDDERRIAEEFVWWRLLLGTHRLRIEDDQTRFGLQQRFRMAENGYVDDLDPVRETRQEPGDDPLADHLAAREQQVTTLVDEALDLMGVEGDEKAAEATRTRAVLDGLSLAVCLRRLTPEQAVTSLGRHVTSVCRWLG